MNLLSQYEMAVGDSITDCVPVGERRAVRLLVLKFHFAFYGPMIGALVEDRFSSGRVCVV
jgi:hypothetical protein